MEDDQIQSRIDTLENEERGLRHDEQTSAEAGRDDQVAAARDRLGEIKVELDQLWDLLRQRRALRNSGGNPDDAQMRDPGTVERYLG
jgi:Protein of unknown function (DUF2630)